MDEWGTVDSQMKPKSHVLLDGEHINLEEYRIIMATRARIKKQGEEASKLSAEAKSKAQLAHEARFKRDRMVSEYFGWVEDTQ